MSSRLWQRLEPVALVLGPVLCLALAGVSSIWRQQARRDVDAAQAHNLELRDRLDELPASAGPQAARRPSQLQDAPDLVGTMRDLEAVAVAAAAGLAEARPDPASSSGRQPFLLRGQCGIDKLCALVAAIENHPRLMLLESGRVEVVAGDELRYEFALATFHRVEEHR